MTKRPCRSCGRNKSLESYHRKKNGKFGRHSICKVCVLRSKKKVRRQAKIAKQTPPKSRSILVSCDDFEVSRRHVKNTNNQVEDAVEMLIDAINTVHLISWEASLWEEKEEANANSMDFPMGA